MHDIRVGDAVAIRLSGIRREVIVDYVDYDYDFSKKPPEAIVVQINGRDVFGKSVVWKKNIDGGNCELVQGGRE